MVVMTKYYTVFLMLFGAYLYLSDTQCSATSQQAQPQVGSQPSITILDPAAFELANPRADTAMQYGPSTGPSVEPASQRVLAEAQKKILSLESSKSPQGPVSPPKAGMSKIVTGGNVWLTTPTGKMVVLGTGALVAAGTTAAIVGSIHHTQTLILDASLLNVPDKVYDVIITYMTIPGLDFADMHHEFAIRVGKNGGVRLEDNKGLDITNKKNSDVTLVKTGDKVAVNVRRGAWCIRAFSIKERGVHHAEVSREIPISKNRCKGHIFGVARQGEDLKITIVSLGEQ